MSDPPAGPPPRSPVRSAADLRYARFLGTGFLALLGLTVGLIVLGALVRAHGAGLACPDWPLCFGRVVPEMDLRVGFEWSHRAVAGAVGLGFLGLGAALLARPATRRAASGLYALAAGLLALQVLLGALTVWHLLAEWTVTSHLLVGNAFGASLLLLGLRLRDAGRPAPPGPAADGAVRTAALGAAGLLVLQLALGGLVASSYAGLACPAWPTCDGERFVPTLEGAVGLHLAHRWNAVLLLGGLGLYAALAHRRAPHLRASAALAFALGAVQLAVGVANVWLRVPVEVTGLHSALAAALVLVLAHGLRGAFAGTGPGGAEAQARATKAPVAIEPAGRVR